MDLSRISSSIDVKRLQQSHVAVVGLGGSRDLVCNLCRSGMRRFSLFDFDRVEPSNIARQGHSVEELGLSKVEATAQELRRINPAVEVETYAVDFTSLTDEEVDSNLHGVDLLVMATDRFAAQARGNEIALRLDIPAVWIGLYAGGLGGEVIFWHADIDACFRCLCDRRYEAHEKTIASGNNLDPPSDGVTIFDVQMVDSIAGQIAIGLLTRGSDTRYGRLIDELGDRNFIQIKIDPKFEIAGRDVIREKLGIAADRETYFAWNTIVRSDPDQGRKLCLDCENYRGRVFNRPDSKTIFGNRPPGSIH